MTEQRKLLSDVTQAMMAEIWASLLWLKQEPCRDRRKARPAKGEA